MINYNESSFTEALKSVGLKNGDIVFCHSNIGFFGFPEEGKDKLITFNVILKSFLNVIGDQGTLIVPTFTYSFSNNKIFDPIESVSDCGYFAEEVRKLPLAIRSEDPFYSVAALGNKARQLVLNVPQNSFSKDSFFNRFYKLGGVICNMNFDAGSTFIHYVERELKVPYRFDKTFEGIIRKKLKEEKRKATIWVRYLSSEGTIPVFETFDSLARENNLFKTAKVGRGFVGLITAKDTFSLIERTLPSRPWFLTKAEQLGIIPELIPEKQ